MRPCGAGRVNVSHLILDLLMSSKVLSEHLIQIPEVVDIDSTVHPSPLTMYTSMRFLKRLPLYAEEKPYRLFTNLPPESTDQKHTNLEFEEKEVLVHDIRDKVSPPTLDANGFEVRRIPTSLDLGTMWNREMVEKVYLPEVDTLLRGDSSIDEVFLFDWRVSHPVSCIH